MKDIAYYNGKISQIDEMTVPMNDRAVYFGDGVYDAAYLRNRKIFAADDHLDRFYSSCRLLEIPFTMPREELGELLASLAAKLDGAGDGMIYWQASRGTAPRGHACPEGIRPNLLAYAKTIKPLEPDKPVKLITADDVRYKLCHIKTLNLVPNILAMQRAAAAGCDEAVFIRDGEVTECAHSTLFIISGGVLRTAPLSEKILPGTVRKQLFELCPKIGLPFEEKAFGIGEVFAADEVFITSATALIRRVASLDGRPVGFRNAALFGRLRDAYLALVEGEVGGYEGNEGYGRF